MIRTQRRSGTLLLALDRPERRNCLHPEMIQSLAGALSAANSDPGLRAVVLTGEGGSFCAGLDLDHLSALEAAERPGYVRTAFALFRQVYELRQPVVAAVDGPAIAGGFDLAVFCDLRICSERAVFGQFEILLGLTQILHPLHEIIGLGNAKFLAMTGASIDAVEALRIGLVHRICRHESMLDEAFELAEDLADRPPKALSESKRLSREVIEMDFDGAFQRMLEAICIRLESAEHTRALERYRGQLGADRRR